MSYKQKLIARVRLALAEAKEQKRLGDRTAIVRVRLLARELYTIKSSYSHGY